MPTRIQTEAFQEQLTWPVLIHFWKEKVCEAERLDPK